MPGREVACPSCGGPVRFQTAIALLAVCGYCRATLMRRDLDVEQIGTMAELLPDPTPLQLGAEGRYRGTHFAVVGRIQVRYDDGGWNEWYLAFDDGRQGWLSEAVGEYAVSFEAEVPEEPLPAWETLAPGLVVMLGQVRYEVTDRRQARVVGGEGELPFRVEGGFEVAVADLRTDSARFATIDYGDYGDADAAADPRGHGKERPRLYVGETVELGALDLRGMREFEGWR
jgi:hypothetical protein